MDKQSSSSSTLNILNRFYNTSITLFNDSSYQFKKQDFKNSQVVSINNYSFNPVYAKILVSPPFFESVSPVSNIFSLVTTIAGIATAPIKQNIQSLGTTQDISVYQTALQIKNSDFINQNDGTIFMSLEANLNVSLSIPIQIKTFNNSFSPLMLDVPQKIKTEFQTLSMIEIENSNYTKDVFGQKIFFSDIAKHTLLCSVKNCFIRPLRVVNLEDVSCFIFTTDSGSVILPANALVYTKDKFENVNSTITQIFYNDQPLKIKEIKTQKQNISLIIPEQYSDYFYNGVYLINPLNLQYKNSLCLKNQISNSADHSITINKYEYKIFCFGNTHEIKLNKNYNPYEEINIFINSDVRTFKILYKTEHNVFFSLSCNIEVYEEFKVSHFEHVLTNNVKIIPEGDFELISIVLKYEC